MAAKHAASQRAADPVSEAADFTEVVDSTEAAVVAVNQAGEPSALRTAPV